jgi:hypothetical protein
MAGYSSGVPVEIAQPVSEQHCSTQHSSTVDLSMCRIRRNGQEPIVDVDTLDQLEPAIRSSEPGRYHVDQLERDPLPSGYTSRRWGIGIKQHDGRVVIEPDPWDK